MVRNYSLKIYLSVSNTYSSFILQSESNPRNCFKNMDRFRTVPHLVLRNRVTERTVWPPINSVDS